MEELSGFTPERVETATKQYYNRFVPMHDDQRGREDFMYAQTDPAVLESGEENEYIAVH